MVAHIRIIMNNGHTDKLDFGVLKKHAQLAFLIAWNLANN
jgi:hypothetical protein